MISNATVMVRPATDKDVETLGSFGAELMSIHHGWDRYRFIPASPRTPEMYSRYLESQLGKPDVLVLAADVDGVLAGYVYAGVEGADYMALRGPAGVIYDLFVATLHRRKGVGRILVSAAVQNLNQLGASQIVLSTASRNEAAQRLFATMGFSPTMVEMTLQLPRPGVDP